MAADPVRDELPRLARESYEALPPERKCEVDALAEYYAKDIGRATSASEREFARDYMSYTTSPRTLDDSYRAARRTGGVTRDCTIRGS